MFEQLEHLIITNLQSIYDHIGWLGVTGLLVFENATGIIPSEIILGLAGWMLLAAHEAPLISIFTWGIVVAFASTAGASITYWASRLGGRPLVNHLLCWFRIESHQAEKVEAQFHKWGMGFVLFGRMIPGVRTLINIPAGLARLPFLRFLIYTFLGAYLWCTLLLGIGYFLGNEWWYISGYVQQAAPWLLGAGLLTWAGMVIWKRSARKMDKHAVTPAGEGEKPIGIINK